MCFFKIFSSKSFVFLFINISAFSDVILFIYFLNKWFRNSDKSTSALPAKTLTTTEGEHPQLCLCISSTLLKLLTDSACSQSDDLPCCACITRTSATFANDDKRLFDQRRRSKRPDKLGKDRPVGTSFRAERNPLHPNQFNLSHDLLHPAPRRFSLEQQRGNKQQTFPLCLQKVWSQTLF